MCRKYSWYPCFSVVEWNGDGETERGSDGQDEDRDMELEQTVVRMDNGLEIFNVLPLLLLFILFIF